MSWIQGECQGDREWECVYQRPDGSGVSWCIDSDEECILTNADGVLIRSTHHPGGAGGGWGGSDGQTS